MAISRTVRPKSTGRDLKNAKRESPAAMGATAGLSGMPSHGGSGEVGSAQKILARHRLEIDCGDRRNLVNEAATAGR